MVVDDAEALAARLQPARRRSGWRVPARRESLGASWRIARSSSSGDISSVVSTSSGVVLAGAVREDSPCIRKSSEDGMEAADGAAENGNMDSSKITWREMII
jgi:hypothetical protein